MTDFLLEAVVVMVMVMVIVIETIAFVFSFLGALFSLSPLTLTKLLPSHEESSLVLTPM